MNAAGSMTANAGPERRRIAVSWIVLLLGLPSVFAAEPRPGEFAPRRGDEIVVCGQLVHTTAPVVLWMDPGGFDAHRVERRFAPLEKADGKSTRDASVGPVRFGLRKGSLSAEQLEEVRGGGWRLPLLQEVVDQFVLHYDAVGTSRTCFEVLHDRRGLSVHFLLDLDGTIYQTLDLKEAAWHATIANGRSIGIEIANIGAYPAAGPDPLAKWYSADSSGATLLLLPRSESKGRLARPGWTPRPIRPQPIVGEIQGLTLRQYDLTTEQYDSLARLTATLCKVFPKISCDYPRDAAGNLVRHKLPDPELMHFQGILGHFHVQTNKQDPGPAFQWEKLVSDAKTLLDNSPSLRPRQEAERR